MTGKNTNTMKQLPAEEQPYEKCWDKGPAFLSDAELLSVILRTGSRGETALSLAGRILYEPPGRGLTGLYHMSMAELCSIRGIGKVKAAQLLCITELSRRISRENARESLCFMDPQSVADYYMEDYRHEEQEKVLLLMLSSKGMLLGQEVISIGTVNAAMISPREIFLCALQYHAVSVILMHNHPSGNPSPSREDIILTGRVRECGELLGIELLDHIIIGDQCSFSMRKEGLLLG